MEQVQRNIYRALLNVPHRNLHDAVYAFRASIAEDPYFTPRLVTHINTPGSGYSVRDNQEAGIIAMFQFDPGYREIRDAARAILLGRDVYPDSGMPGLEPYRVLRVIDYLRSPWVVARGNDVFGHFASPVVADAELPTVATNAGVEPDEMEVRRDRGHVQAVRQAEGAFRDWLSMLEGDESRIDGLVMYNRARLRALWKHFHLGPKDFPMMARFLFGDPPEGTKVYWLAIVSEMEDPIDKAVAVIERGIPYLNATGLFGPGEFGSAVKAAMIDAMTSGQALRSIGWVEKSGLLDNDEIREVFEAKVAQVRDSLATIEGRASAQTQDEGVRAAVREAKRESVKRAPAKITRGTLLLMDRSDSLGPNIEFTHELVTHIAPYTTDAPFVWVAFNTRVQEVEVDDINDPEAVARAVRYVTANGGTSFGNALLHGLSKYEDRYGEWPEQVVFTSDMQELHSPFIDDVMARMREARPLGMPRVLFLKVPGGEDTGTWERLPDQGYDVELLDFTGAADDYMLFDQVVSFLGGKNVVQEILELDLPQTGRLNGRV